MTSVSCCQLLTMLRENDMCPKHQYSKWKTKSSKLIRLSLTRLLILRLAKSAFLKYALRLQTTTCPTATKISTIRSILVTKQKISRMLKYRENLAPKIAALLESNRNLLPKNSLTQPLPKHARSKTYSNRRNLSSNLIQTSLLNTSHLSGTWTVGGLQRAPRLSLQP